MPASSESARTTRVTRRGVAGEVQRGLPGGVGAADDVDVALRQAGRLGRSTPVVDARPRERVELGDAQTTVAGTGREQDGSRAQHAALRELDEDLVAARIPSQTGCSLHQHEAGAEHPGLGVGALGEPPTGHAGREAQVVADERARRGLAADATFIHDQRAEALRRAVHRGRQPRRSGADDDEVVVATLGAHRRSGRRGELGVARVAQHPAVGQDDEGQLAAGSGSGDERPPVLGVGQPERVGHRTSSEHVPQLVRPTGPRLPDDVDGERRSALGLRPIEQQTGDRVMEQLVRMPLRLEHVVVDAPARDRVEDRIADDPVAGVAPADDEPTLRMRVQSPGLIQQSAPLGADDGERNEEHGQLGARNGELLEAGGRLRCRHGAADVVLPAVPVVELVLQRREPVSRVVDDDDHWARHPRTLPAARCAATGSTRRARERVRPPGDAMRATR